MTPELARLIQELEKLRTGMQLHFNKPLCLSSGTRMFDEFRYGMGYVRRAIRKLIPETALVDDLLNNAWNCFQSNGEDELACRNEEMLIEELAYIAQEAGKYLTTCKRPGIFWSDRGEIDTGQPIWGDSGITEEVGALIQIVEAYVVYQTRQN